jgi:3-hydroxybutyryl-CoA dehydrogenase
MASPAMAVQTVAVIGAGAAGRSVAIRCARAGLDVVLEDVMPVRLRRAQDEYAELSSSYPHTLPGSDAQGLLPRPGTLRYALTVEDAVQNADLAIDFVPDELESKLEIFSLLDRMAPPRTILCTPTRTLSITDLASCTYRAGLCVGVSGQHSGVLEGEVHILRSRFVEQAALDAVQHFLHRLGVAAEIVDDREEPMLVKNRSL